ncbi:hypothetical protein LTR66_011883 [Elasticomyces elasticus]|nr:hypothetical protein LTR66_011883 [Elasticomyces elasticus]
MPPKKKSAVNYYPKHPEINPLPPRRSSRLTEACNANGRSYLADQLGWTVQQMDEWITSCNVRPFLRWWKTRCFDDLERRKEIRTHIESSQVADHSHYAAWEAHVFTACVDEENVRYYEKRVTNTGDWNTADHWARTAHRIVKRQSETGGIFDSAVEKRPASAERFVVELLCLAFHSLVHRGVDSVYCDLITGTAPAGSMSDRIAAASSLPMLVGTPAPRALHGFTTPMSPVSMLGSPLTPRAFNAAHTPSTPLFDSSMLATHANDASKLSDRGSAPIIATPSSILEPSYQGYESDASTTSSDSETDDDDETAAGTAGEKDTGVESHEDQSSRVAARDLVLQLPHDNPDTVAHSTAVSSSTPSPPPSGSREALFDLHSPPQGLHIMGLPPPETTKSSAAPATVDADADSEADIDTDTSAAVSASEVQDCTRQQLELSRAA